MLLANSKVKTNSLHFQNWSLIVFRNISTIPGIYYEVSRNPLYHGFWLEGWLMILIHFNKIVFMDFYKEVAKELNKLGCLDFKVSVESWKSLPASLVSSQNWQTFWQLLSDTFFVYSLNLYHCNCFSVQFLISQCILLQNRQPIRVVGTYQWINHIPWKH